MHLQSQQSTCRQLQDRANKCSKEQTRPLTAAGRCYLSSMMTGMMNKICFDAKVHISFYSSFSSAMQLHKIVKKRRGGGGGMDKPKSLLMMTSQMWPLQIEWHFIDKT
jgi:hypothetical protein